jgi:hypothetical protein
MSDLEHQLVAQLAYLGISQPVLEYRFHPVRRWRFDLAWPDLRVACEVEGATWANGRHTRGSGFEADAIKYNTAAIDGWLVIRVTGNMVKDGRAHQAVRDAIAARRSAS